jgi:beta-lactamase regulating signal transducer with metallopeptidase domain
MTDAMEWIGIGLTWCLLAALAAAPLAVFVWTIDAICGRWMAAKWRCALWTLVAARLLLPVGPPSGLSLQNLWLTIEGESDHLRLVRSAPEPSGATPAQPVVPWRPAPPARLATDHVSNDAKGAAPAVPARHWPSEAVASVWALVAAGLMLRSTVASWRFARQLRAIPEVDHGTAIDVLVAVCRDLGVRRRPAVKLLPQLATPAVFGAVRPTICLPVESCQDLDAEELRSIMLHEIAHVRRGDGYLSWLIAVVRAVQWFNPIAWLATSRMALYREQACDDAVRGHTAPERRQSYVELLVRLAQRRPSSPLGLLGVGLTRSVRHLAARIAAYQAPDDRRRALPRAVVAGILGLTAVVGLSDAATVEPRPNPDATPTVGEWMNDERPSAVEQTVSDPLDDGDDALREERTYEASAAIEKLSESLPQAEVHRQFLAYLKLPSWDAENVQLDEQTGVLRATMTPGQHEAFAEFLTCLERSGPWQVVIRARVLGADQIEALGDIDWESAVRFADPNGPTPRDPFGPDRVGYTTNRELVCSGESESWTFDPFLALVLDKPRWDRIFDEFQRHPRRNIAQCPTTTVFSGQTAIIRDEAQAPFVIGVNYVKGDLVSAAEPRIALLRNGRCLEIHPVVVDEDKLVLQCRLTINKILRVDEVKVPGKDITIQVPQVSQQTINAECGLVQGETLLLAPLRGEWQEDDGAREAFLYAISAQWFPDALINDASQENGKVTSRRSF